LKGKEATAMSVKGQVRSTKRLDVSMPAIKTAAATLAGGGLVAFPTETVYGLGGDACNAEAVAAIFAAKGRPAFNPLISHVDSADHAFALGMATPPARALAARFWPGPLTLVLTRRADCPIARLTSAGLDRIALRVPASEAAQRLLTAFGGPVAAPSANPSGRISPTRADHVMAGLDGRIDVVLDGGRCDSGVESTVVDCSGDRAMILRPGGITRQQVADCLAAAGLELAVATSPSDITQLASPGMLASHYAPRAALEMNVTRAEPGMEMIGFGDIEGAGASNLNLSPSGDLVEAAANLFDMLHRADATGSAVIGVAPIPAQGLGEAINDRLRRAAAPRKTR
jgi:L-threonylcarbamoyladenylate synthase